MRRRLSFFARALVVAALALPVVPASAAWPGTNGTIAYSQADLVLLNRNLYSNAAPNGQLLSGGALQDQTPTYSPDGSKIAFVRRSILTPILGDAEIYVMNADGSGTPVNVSNDPGNDNLNPTWSPDGTKILYNRPETVALLTVKQQIWAMNATGGGHHAFFNSPTSTNDTQPAWSPTGNTLAFVRDNGNGSLLTAILGGPSKKIHTVGINTSQVKAQGSVTQRTPNDTCTLLSCSAWYDDMKPDWHPTLNKLAFDRRTHALTNRQVFVSGGTSLDLSATGAGAMTPINLIAVGDSVQPAWSPDGTRIVFARRNLGGLLLNKVVTMNATGVPGSAFTDISQNLLLPNDQPSWGPATSPPPLIPEVPYNLLLPTGAAGVLLIGSIRRRQRLAPL